MIKKAIEAVKSVSAKVTFSHYWNEDHSHTPYMHVPYGEDKKETSTADIVEDLFNQLDLDDGDQIEITVRSTGKRPFGDRRVVWAKAHTYRRETKAECAKRLEQNGRKTKKSNSKNK